METLDILYIVIAVAVALLTGFLIWNLIDLNKTMKRWRKTLGHANKIMENVEIITTASRESIKGIMDSVKAFNNQVIKPITNFTNIFSKIGALTSIFTSSSSKEEDKEKENAKKSKK